MAPPSVTIPEDRLGQAYGAVQLSRLLRYIDADMVVDVGAHAGEYGLLVRRALGYGGQIVSVEPLPAAYAKLQAAAADDARWQTHCCAIGARAGRADFHVMVGSQFSSLLPPAAGYAGAFGGQHRVADVIEVPVQTLDALLAGCAPWRNGLLKLDVQGHELAVLEGAGATLASFAALQIELAMQPIYDGGPDYRQVIDALAGRGYRLCALFPNNAGHFPHLVELDALFLRAERLGPLP